MKIRLTKVSGKPTSHIKPGYWVEGWGSWPEVGKSLYLDRPIKSSLNEQFEWFQTTKVNEVNEKMDGGSFIETNNSQWRIEEVHD